jgi:hypothetical protein
MIDVLIEAAQLEVIYQELPTVIGDAIVEQASWNRFQVATETTKSGGRSRSASSATGSVTTPEPPEALTGASGAPPWVFTSPGHKRLDPFVAMVSAAERARLAIDDFSTESGTPARPADTRLGQFFRQSYRVGSEQLLRDIPTPVLLELLAVSLLVVRNIVLGLFGESAARIKRNPLYRFGLDLPLQVFHRLAVLSRRSPGAGLAAFISLMVISALALAVGLGFRNEIIWRDGRVYLKWLVVFIVAPVLILVLQVGFLLRGGRLFGSRSRRQS